MSNYGDDLFSMAAFLGSQKYWSRHDPWLLCDPIPGLDASYSVLPLIPKGGLASDGMKGKFFRLSNLIWSSIHLDKIVYAGGSLFGTASSGSRDTLLYLKRGRKDCFSAIGISVGPFADSLSEKKIIDTLKRFSYISARDSTSYDRLVSYNLDSKVVQASDLAGVLPSLVLHNAISSTLKDEVSKGDHIFQIGFSPCYLPGSDEKAKYYCDEFISFASRISSEKFLHVTVICLNQHPIIGDVALCKYVFNKLTSRGIDCSFRLYQEEGILETWNLISKLNAYYSVRLHGAVTAYLSGTPFLLFEYHEKCTKFLDFIGKPLDQRVEMHQQIGADLSSIFQKVLDSSVQSKVSIAEYTHLSEKNFTSAPFV